MQAKAAGNWDMTPFFSAPASDDYSAFTAALSADIDDVGTRARKLEVLGADNASSWADLLCELEGIEGRLTHLFSYLGCLGAADSSDEWVQKEIAKLARWRGGADKILVTVKAAIRDASADDFAALLASESLQGASYYISRLRIAAKHSMSADLEALASDLGIDGFTAWGRLYDQISGTLSFELETGGEKETVPVAMTRSLLESSDEDQRVAALAGANKAWEGVSDSLAASLNAIAGTRLTLYQKRGIDHFLTPALFDSGIKRSTLDAMLDAVKSRRSVPWRYYQLKARVLGRDRLRFSDLMAPFPSDGGGQIPWDHARKTVLSAFGDFYPLLRDFADGAFADQWIDYEPRAGKRPGGFCTSSPIIGQSRVFMTYNQTGGDMQTLAHELGHAFHGSLMKDMRYWSTVYPMTLAETASTFAEALVTDALLGGELSPRQRLAVLDGKLSDAATFMCNTPMRFVFERSFYEERAAGEVSVSRLCELMKSAQLECYGESLDPEALDPWFWASKLHFYITDVSFYNFPYTFGYLFSMGLFARAKAEGPAFLATYEKLLRMTGSAPAEEVAREVLGVDLGQPDFWNQSIDLIESDLDAYHTLLNEDVL